MSDIYASIFSYTTKFNGKNTCSNTTLNGIFKQIPLPHFSESQLQTYNNFVKNGKSMPKSSYDIGFFFPFQPQMLEQIDYASFDDNDFITLYILNSYIAWTIFHEKIQTLQYAELVFKSLAKASLLSFHNISAHTFMHMYSLLLESNFQFSISTLRIIKSFTVNNKEFNSDILLLLGKTHLKTDTLDDDISNALLKLIAETARNMTELESGIADSVILDIEKPICELNNYAIEAMEYLMKFANHEKHSMLFVHIPEKLVELILNDDRRFSWPEDCHEEVTISRQVFMVTTRTPEDRTFSPGNIAECVEVPEICDNMFCSPKIMEKAMKFLPVVSSDIEFTTVFSNTLYNKTMDNKESKQFPAMLSSLVFMCLTLQSMIPAFCSVSLLAHSPIFTPRVTIFDNPKNFDTMSLLRREIVLLALKEGGVSFGELLLTFQDSPRVLAEIFYRMAASSDSFLMHITQFPLSVREINKSLLIYRNLYLTEDDSKMRKEIELVRRSQIAFLDTILRRNSIASIFYSNLEFINQVLAMFAEVQLRPFVKEKVIEYTERTDINGLSFLIGPIVSFIEEMRSHLDDPSYCTMMVDTIDIISEMHSIRNGLSSIIGPVHEMMNISITQMPPSPDTERVLFAAIKCLTNAGSDNMLGDKSMDKLGNSIIKFYRGSPTEDLYLLLVRLFIGNNADMENPEIQIDYKHALLLLFKVFYQTKFFDRLVSLIDKVISYSSSNAFVAHSCGLDSLLLDIFKNCRTEKNRNPKFIKPLLKIFTKISSNSTSTEIVYDFIDLLEPMEDMNFSVYYKDFLETMYDIVLSNYLVTRMTINISSNTIFNRLSMTSNNFALGFWVYVNKIPRKDKSFKLIRIFIADVEIELTLRNQCIYISTDNSEVRKIHPMCWTYINLGFNINKDRPLMSIIIDNERLKRVSLSSQMLKDFEFVTYEIGQTDSSFDLEVSKFEVTNELKDDDLQNILGLGPFNYTPNAFHVMKSVRPCSLKDGCFTDIFSRLGGFSKVISLLRLIDQSFDESFMYFSIIGKALSTDELIQEVFLTNDHVKSIAHLLLSFRKETLRYDMYCALFSVFISLTNLDLKKELFRRVLMNPDVWIAGPKAEHEAIVAHWSRVLVVSFLPYSAEIRPFSLLLDIIYLYYWERPATSRFAVRERPPDLDVSFCRSHLHVILLSVARCKFSSGDFIRLLSHCYSCKNIDFSMYLMLLMNSLLMELPGVIRSVGLTSEDISIFQYLMNVHDDRLSSDVIEAIVQIHRLNVVDPKMLGRHLDALMFSMDHRCFGHIFFKRILSMLATGSAELLSLACWYCTAGGESERLELAEWLDHAEGSFACTDLWLLWPVLVAISVQSLRIPMFRFLVRQLVEGNQWIQLIPVIHICSHVLRLDPDIGVASLMNAVIDNKSVERGVLFEVVQWYLSHRSSPRMSEPLAALAGVEQVPPKEPLDPSTVSWSNFCSVVCRPVPVFAVGARMDGGGKWTDLMIGHKITALAESEASIGRVEQVAFTLLMLAHADSVFIEQTCDILMQTFGNSAVLQQIRRLAATGMPISDKVVYQLVFDALEPRSVSIQSVFKQTSSKLEESLHEFFDVLLPKFSSVTKMAMLFDQSIAKTTDDIRKTGQEAESAWAKLEAAIQKN